MLVKSLQLFLILVIVSLPISEILGQSDFREGYIITNTNDSIPVYLDYQPNASLHEKLRFKKALDASVEEYFPNDLIRFRFKNDKLFRSIRNEEVANGELVFIQVLVKGRLTFSKYNSAFLLEKEGDDNVYNLNNKEVEQSELKGLSRQKSTRQLGVINLLINDCDGQVITEYFRLTEKKVTEIVEKYNRCTGTRSITYLEDKPFIGIQYGLTLGATNNYLSVENLSSGNNNLEFSDFGYDLKPLYGLNLLLTLPRISDRYALNIDLLYTSSEFSAYGPVNSNPATTNVYNYLEFSLNSLKVPIAIRYILPERAIGAYINVGPVLYTHLKYDWNTITERRVGSDIITTQVSEEGLRPIEVGVWAGLGITKSITNKVGAFVEIRAERSNSFLSERILMGRNSGVGKQYRNHLNLVLGFQIK